MGELKDKQHGLPGQPQRPTSQDQMPNQKQGKQKQEQQGGKKPYDPNQVGKDTDGDGRVVQPGARPGEVDGDKQKKPQHEPAK